MYKTKILILLVFAVISVPAQESGLSAVIDEWARVVPLKSTRTDIEQIFGTPVKQDFGNSTYQSDSAMIRVLYSTGPCKGIEKGWIVPADTALLMVFSPNHEIRISADEFKNKKVIQYGGTWLLQAEGMAYELDYGVDDKEGRLIQNVIKRVSIMPKESHNSLRCKGFPTYHPAGLLYHPEVVISRTDAISGLDNVVSTAVNRDTDDVTYVVVYADKEMSLRAYDELFKRYEKHLYKKRKAPIDKIRLIKGGVRDAFSIEVFYLTTSLPPPVPSPDHPSADF